jgi:hypothetical protein
MGPTTTDAFPQPQTNTACAHSGRRTTTFGTSRCSTTVRARTRAVAHFLPISRSSPARMLFCFLPSFSRGSAALRRSCAPLRVRPARRASCGILKLSTPSGSGRSCRFCRSIDLSIYLSICLSIYRSVYLSFCPSVNTDICLSIPIPVSLCLRSALTKKAGAVGLPNSSFRLSSSKL